MVSTVVFHLKSVRRVVVIYPCSIIQKSRKDKWRASQKTPSTGEGLKFRKFDRTTTNMVENKSRNSPNAANVLAHFSRVRSLELTEFRASFDLEEHLVPSRAHNLGETAKMPLVSQVSSQKTNSCPRALGNKA